jgi:hypothetical protein
MRKYAVILTVCLAGGSARCSTSTQLKEHIPSHLRSSIRRRCEWPLGSDVCVNNALVAAVTPEALRFAHLPMDLRLAARRHDETRPAASTVGLASRLSVLLSRKIISRECNILVNPALRRIGFAGFSGRHPRCAVICWGYGLCDAIGQVSWVYC